MRWPARPVASCNRPAERANHRAWNSAGRAVGVGPGHSAEQHGADGRADAALQGETAPCPHPEAGPSRPWRPSASGSLPVGSLRSRLAGRGGARGAEDVAERVLAPHVIGRVALGHEGEDIPGPPREPVRPAAVGTACARPWRRAARPRRSRSACARRSKSASVGGRRAWTQGSTDKGRPNANASSSKRASEQAREPRRQRRSDLNSSCRSMDTRTQARDERKGPGQR